MDLQSFFCENKKAAIAFSGGVDSAYLLYAALQYGADVQAYYVKSAFQPEFELHDAERLCTIMNTKLCVLPVDVLSDEIVCQNPSDRCYYCKRIIFSSIVQRAKEDGFSLLLDGTNASDDASDRPGMRALKELSVRSPLRECGLTKPDIRALSKQAGLFTWKKPAYACLATRIATGECITAEKLQKTERAEGYLYALGFRNFRVRMQGDNAKLQVAPAQMDKVLRHRSEILSTLKKDYKAVLLDLEARSDA